MDDEITFRLNDPPSVVVAWLVERGYRGAATCFPGRPSALLFAAGPNSPVRLAFPGETLVCAGGEVSVREHGES